MDISCGQAVEQEIFFVDKLKIMGIKIVQKNKKLGKKGKMQRNTGLLQKKKLVKVHKSIGKQSL